MRGSDAVESCAGRFWVEVVVVGEDCGWKLWLEVGGGGCGRRLCLFEGHG